MADRRRARRRETTEETPKVAPRPPRLSYPPIEIISADQVEAIHQASLEILRDTGMRVLSGDARALYRAAGAEVRDEVVRFDPGLIEEKMALVPSTFRLEARNPARSLTLGDGTVNFSAVSGPAFVECLDKGRRAGTYAELCDFTKLVQSLDILHQDGGGGFEAMDIPAQRRHLGVYHAQITLTDKNWAPWGLGRVRARDALELAAISLGISLDALTERVVFSCVINTNSPLTLDVPMADGLIELARHGQANIITPFTLAGAMSPITLAGAIAQQNAEALAGIVLTQCVRPGVPAIYGGFTTNVDMRTGSPAFGTPEYMQAAQITGQMARRYGIPFRSSNTTAANCCDAQAAWESQMSLWGAVMGGASLVKHAAGWLGGGLVASFEKLMIDADLLAMTARYLAPPAVASADLAVDAIADVGPGGHFFGTAHTLERYKSAFHEPMLSDWSNYETWSEAGSLTTAERANGAWKAMLKAYEPPPLDAGIREAVDAYCDRRGREIDAGIGVPEI
ncbi:MAG: trimethylamine methyltransferase family protein [Pseudomonadota bacterium]